MDEDMWWLSASALIIGLLLISGCTSSFQDCNSKCLTINSDKYSYNSTCKNYFDMLTNSIDERYPVREINCTKLDSESINDYCFDECKGVK